MGCLSKALEKAALASGERPDAEDALKRKLLDKVLPTAKVTLQPSVSIVVSNGTRLKADVKKYSPPVSGDPGGMSGRDLAILQVPGDNFPVLRLAEAKMVQIGDPMHIMGFPAWCSRMSS